MTKLNYDILYNNFIQNEKIFANLKGELKIGDYIIKSNGENLIINYFDYEYTSKSLSISNDQFTIKFTNEESYIELIIKKEGKISINGKEYTFSDVDIKGYKSSLIDLDNIIKTDTNINKFYHCGYNAFVYKNTNDLIISSNDNDDKKIEKNYKRSHLIRDFPIIDDGDVFDSNFKYSTYKSVIYVFKNDLDLDGVYQLNKKSTRLDTNISYSQMEKQNIDYNTFLQSNYLKFKNEIGYIFLLISSFPNDENKEYINNWEIWLKTNDGIINGYSCSFPSSEPLSTIKMDKVIELKDGNNRNKNSKTILKIQNNDNCNCTLRLYLNIGGCLLMTKLLNGMNELDLNKIESDSNSSVYCCDFNLIMTDCYIQCGENCYFPPVKYSNNANYPNIEQITSIVNSHNSKRYSIDEIKEMITFCSYGIMDENNQQFTKSEFPSYDNGKDLYGNLNKSILICKLITKDYETKQQKNGILFLFFKEKTIDNIINYLVDIEVYQSFSNGIEDIPEYSSYNVPYKVEKVLNNQGQGEEEFYCIFIENFNLAILQYQYCNISVRLCYQFCYSTLFYLFPPQVLYNNKDNSNGDFNIKITRKNDNKNLDYDNLVYNYQGYSDVNLIAFITGTNNIPPSGVSNERTLEYGFLPYMATIPITTLPILKENNQSESTLIPINSFYSNVHLEDFYNSINFNNWTKVYDYDYQSSTYILKVPDNKDFKNVYLVYSVEYNGKEKLYYHECFEVTKSSSNLYNINYIKHNYLSPIEYSTQLRNNNLKIYFEDNTLSILISEGNSNLFNLVGFTNYNIYRNFNYNNYYDIEKITQNVILEKFYVKYE